MKGITRRGNSYTLTVALGLDGNGKQVRKYTTFKPPADVPRERADRLAMRAYEDNDYDFFYSLSDDELVTLWKSCLITATNPYGAAYDDEVYDAISDRPNSRELFDRAASMVESKSSDEFEFDDEFNAQYDGYTEEDKDENSAFNKLKNNVNESLASRLVDFIK